jgi:ankyrin repeat protein
MCTLGRFLAFLSVLFIASCEGKDRGRDIHRAAAEGDVEAVRRILDGDSGLIGLTDDEGRTPLHFAAEGNRVEVAELLLAEGADLDATDRGGDSPLHRAVLYGGPELVDLLLAHHPDLEIRNAYGRTPLHYVARETGSAGLARRLLDAGSELNVPDRYGETPLGLAAWRGFETMVDLFLDRGAGLPEEPEGLDRLTVFSAQHGLARLFGLLVDRGVDLSMANDGGGTLLHSASASGSAGVVEILLREGLDVGGRDRYGWTPLHYAAESGEVDVLALLISRGASVDALSLAGETPYTIAAWREHQEAVQYLEDQGGDTRPPQFPRRMGLYFQEPPPGHQVTLFAPDVVSSNRFEHGSVTFSPDGLEAFWSSSFIVDDSGYSRGRIMTSRVGPEGWTRPDFAPFSTDYVGDDVPFFHPDGNRLFFLSGRTDDPDAGHPGERIWFVDRIEGGWSSPTLVEEGPNLLDKHWQFSVAANGNIYLSSGAPGGQGAGDLYISRYVEGGWLAPENLGSPVNTEHDEFSPFIAPDESYQNLGTIDLYISFRTEGGGWTPPVSLGPSVNSASHDLCPFVSGDGRYLFFNSHRGGQADIFWINAGIIDELRGEGGTLP